MSDTLRGPDEISKGANVVEKGFPVGDGQFELQVDGVSERPVA
ncbi:hypothetical protein [Dactylosporangium darangshiense]|uniref:Uncharacterized protein n=1 Tax=Dactylosporangium darangshiense TaxID=579108 RepID=A0ABP8CUZ1_9ACTN